MDKVVDALKSAKEAVLGSPKEKWDGGVGHIPLTHDNTSLDEMKGR
jgi:hypothetical protein